MTDKQTEAMTEGLRWALAHMFVEMGANPDNVVSGQTPNEFYVIPDDGKAPFCVSVQRTCSEWKPADTEGVAV